VGLDGPALRVSASSRAEQLFPLGRLSRVLSRADANWSTDALIACAERGITITFVGNDGRVRAFVFGRPGSSDTLSGRLLDLIERPDVDERFADWARAMDRRGRLRVAKRLDLHPTRFDLRRLDDVIAKAKVAAAPKTVVAYLERRFAAMVGALVSQKLTQAGIGADLLAGSLSRLCLVQTISETLMWDLQIPLLQTLKRVDDSDPRARIDDAVITQLFERRSRVLDSRAGDVISNLHRWAVELDT
jgi:hypothetical protein